jgi:hypothetical protein
MGMGKMHLRLGGFEKTDQQCKDAPWRASAAGGFPSAGDWRRVSTHHQISLKILN